MEESYEDQSRNPLKSGLMSSPGSGVRPIEVGRPGRNPLKSGLMSSPGI